MNKLLKLFDKYILKIGIAFLIVFTALYPKLPSVHIIRTWVYIRFEDFSILAVTIIWFIQLLRRKVTIPFKISTPIFAYWAAGLLSLIYSLLFIGPHLLNFFPHIAALEYGRRIEYMILFFIAFSTVRNYKDIRDYVIILFLTLAGIIIYGFGQHYYLSLWALFPKFFEQYSFCFPSFQTGNEEFAKGIPLCLPEGARITSTFGGHYDLAAYLVLVLPIVIAVGLGVKKMYQKILSILLVLGGVMLLAFTASRISFAAYLIGAVASLIFYKKKWYIIPVVLISIILLLTTSKSAVQRFASTFRIATIVTNQQGQLVGEETNTLPSSLKNKIAKNGDILETPPPAQNLQQGSSFIGLPAQTVPVATKEAVVQKTLTPDEAKKLNQANGSVQISTVSGSFLIRKALVYDISFTTRFQAEWPNAWNAFLRNPLFGSGYSSITLATDNDYFRALGESGLLGTFTFLLIFVVFGIAVKELAKDISSPLIKGVMFGLAGGAIGLLVNATLIDVFESSKVAENLWILLGIGTGGVMLEAKKQVPYMQRLKTIFSSKFFTSFYLLCLVLAGFITSISNYFVADDFTWLKWASNGTIHDILKYFTNSQGFFYRPLDKTIVFILWNIFSFQPEGYHIFILFLHYLVTLSVYFLGQRIFKQKLPAFLAAIIFLFLPAHGENMYWFSTISVTLAALFIMYTILAFIRFRLQKSIVAYIFAIIFCGLSFLSYEIALVTPLLLFATDIFVIKHQKISKHLLAYIPFILLIPLYFIVRLTTHAFNGGGDYSYSLPHLLPNIIGNSLGYIGLFFGSEKFIPLYETARGSIREIWLMISVALLVILIGLIYGIIKNRTKIAQVVKGEKLHTILYGLVFAFIALIPYLALGNIAERYIYLASVGFSFVFLILLQEIARLLVKSKPQASLLVTVFTLGFVVIFSQQNMTESKEWQKAGFVTRNILANFKTEYPNLAATDNVYLANVPQSLQNAWVFPVGLPDGLWFVYQENTPHIDQVQSVEEAKTKITASGKTNNYIFTIDTQGNIKQVN
jgi:hypothetical protein